MKYEITTERLFLRQPKIDDAKILFKLMSDSRITQFLTWEPHANIEITKKIIQNLIDAQNNDKGYHWCICLNNEIVGLTSLIDVRRNIRTWTLNRAELSYWMGIEFQSKGYTTEACKSIIEYGFNELNLHKIIVAHAFENVESKSICKKLNFSKYAHEHDAFQKESTWHDLIWYELINLSC